MTKPKDRLDSWKEIADYIGRNVGTCIKWTKYLDLPVYRIDKKSSRSRVFAFKSEIDQWFKNRKK
jgi:hypothetical protein